MHNRKFYLLLITDKNNVFQRNNSLYIYINIYRKGGQNGPLIYDLIIFFVQFLDFQKFFSGLYVLQAIKNIYGDTFAIG